ncbi:MAG: signal peptidase II [Parcubacteria group bacterium]|nr:signal peptidase II [Parcubacteria group bacterium]
MKYTKKTFWLLLPIALIVLADEWFKILAIERLPENGSLVGGKLFGLAIHKNIGIAFDIPFKLEFVIAFSVIIGAVLLKIAYDDRIKKPGVSFASLVIVLGAAGNLYDRIVYGYTVDYMIWFERSAINLSDVIIVLGIVLLLLNSRRKRRQRRKSELTEAEN